MGIPVKPELFTFLRDLEKTSKESAAEWDNAEKRCATEMADAKRQKDAAVDRASDLKRLLDAITAP